jgi:hypothetical protein
MGRMGDDFAVALLTYFGAIIFRRLRLQAVCCVRLECVLLYPTVIESFNGVAVEKLTLGEQLVVDEAQFGLLADPMIA